MRMSERQQLLLWLIGIVIASFVLFKYVPVFLDYFGVRDSPFFTIGLIALVLILPIANSLKALRYLFEVLESDDGDVSEDFRNRYHVTDFIPFVNDWKFSSLYYDGENNFKLVVSWINKISCILLPMYLLYLNLLVVFIDLGVGFTIFLMDSLVYVIIAYILSKFISVAHLLIELGAPAPISILMGATVLFGYMYIPYSTKVYIERQFDINYDKRLGEDIYR